MKVLGLVGSPKEGGNTEIMVKEILEGSSENGAETKIYNLNERDIKPCQACMHCKSHDGECKTNDDMQILIKNWQKAMPSYWFTNIHVADDCTG